MGDQRRSDSDRAKASQDEPDKRKPRDEADAQFDPAHAQTQQAFHRKGSIVDQPSIPTHVVENNGRIDEQETRYAAAKTAKNAAQVIAVVREMGSVQRETIKGDLTELATFMSAREIIHVGGLTSAALDVTLIAACDAKPSLTLPQARAFLMDVSASRLGEGFWNTELVEKLGKLGSPIEVLPQIAESGVLNYLRVVEWFIDKTPAKTVARVLLELNDKDVPEVALVLDHLGPKGWTWLTAIDGQIAKTASGKALIAYSKHAHEQAQKADDKRTIDDAKNAEKLDRWKKVNLEEPRGGSAQRGDAAWLRAHRKDVIEKSSLQQLQQQMEEAGLPSSEQLDWILDRPGITPQQMRDATVLMTTDTIEMTNALITKLQKRFPKTPVEELFSGDLPYALIEQGSQKPAIAKWMLAGAQPEAILRIVARSPALIDEWCTTLVSAKIGFAWVRQLGGFYNDMLLRRFVIKCPDRETRDFIQQRILGEGQRPGTTMTKGVASPTAYTSNRSHLDADLDRYKTKSNVASDELAADVGELTAAEIQGLRRDPKRLEQVLSTANKKTFAQILEQVSPPLGIALDHATPELITPAQFVAWTQSRPGADVSTTLSDEERVDQIRELVPKFGPFELFSAIAQPTVLGPVLKQNPGIVPWLLESDATRVLPALTAPAVIDAAVRALTAFDDNEALDEWMPSAAALGGIGKTIYVQLHARAKGGLRDVLDAKLKAKLARKSEDEDQPAADENALTLREPGLFTKRLDVLFTNDAPRSTLLTLCRSEPAAWREVAASPKTLATLKSKLEDLSPDVIFNVPLATLLTSAALHAWIFEKVTPLRIVGAFTSAADAAVAKSLEEGGLRRNFFNALPRGRGFTAAHKQSLHRIAKLVSDRIHAEMFEMTFDVELAREKVPFTRPELDKIWTVMELVPHAHVDQKSISSFKPMAESANGTKGIYYPDSKQIGLQTGQLGVKDATQYDLANRMTEAQAIEAVGSKDNLTRFVNEGRIIETNGMYEWQYIQNLDAFSHAILHEIGHAVDYMLGAQTELIYELVGWKRFHTSDFDQWAKSLGGWDSVTDPDKKQIRDVWISWLQAGGSGKVADLVDPEHPAVAKKYAHVGVVQAASLQFGQLPMLVGNVWVNREQRAFMTLSMKGYNATPSVYALTAPAEYFAECYANYYREYDGTPKTAANKGANLAPWIKSWFDTHIDKLGHNPIRHGRD